MELAELVGLVGEGEQLFDMSPAVPRFRSDQDSDPMNIYVCTGTAGSDPEQLFALIPIPIRCRASPRKAEQFIGFAQQSPASPKGISPDQPEQFLGFPQHGGFSEGESPR